MGSAGSDELLALVRTVLTTALEQVAQVERTAEQALAAVRHTVAGVQRVLEHPPTWADLLPWALAKLSELDPRVSVVAEGEAIVARFVDDDLGVRASVALTAFGAGPASAAIDVVVPPGRLLDLHHGPVAVTGSGQARWRVDAAGPAVPDGDGQVGLRVRLPATWPVVADAGVSVGVDGDLVAEVSLAGHAPLWSVSVAAPRFSAGVSPGALLGVPVLPDPGVAFAPSFHAAQGGAVDLDLGWRP